MTEIKNNGNPITNLTDRLKRELPPMWEILETGRLTGGVIKSRTMRNRINMGTGPETMKFGAKVVIPRSEFIRWFASDLRNRETA